MLTIGGNDHASCGDLVSYLLCGKMTFSVCHSFHFRSHDPEPRTLQLSHRLETIRGNASNVFSDFRMVVTGTTSFRIGRFDSPVGGKEIPRSLAGWPGHSRSIGRGEGQRPTDVGCIGKGTGIGPLCRRRWIVSSP